MTTGGITWQERIATLTNGFHELAELLEVPPVAGPVENYGRANQPHKLDLLLRAADGPLAVALGAVYLQAADVSGNAPYWSVSCLPQWAGTRGDIRAMTASIGSRESFWVWMDKSTGKLSQWAVLVAESDQREEATFAADRLGLILVDSITASIWQAKAPTRSRSTSPPGPWL